MLSRHSLADHCSPRSSLAHHLFTERHLRGWRPDRNVVVQERSCTRPGLPSWEIPSYTAEKAGTKLRFLLKKKGGDNQHLSKLDSSADRSFVGYNNFVVASDLLCGGRDTNTYPARIKRFFPRHRQHLSIQTYAKHEMRRSLHLGSLRAGTNVLQ